MTPTTQMLVATHMTEMHERHFTVLELCRKWHLACATVRRWFENEPGVIRVGQQRLRRGKRASPVTLRVPESIALKVYTRHTALE